MLQAGKGEGCSPRGRGHKGWPPHWPRPLRVQFRAGRDVAQAGGILGVIGQRVRAHPPEAGEHEHESRRCPSASCAWRHGPLLGNF
jgi:hypothetical protein